MTSELGTEELVGEGGRKGGAHGGERAKVTEVQLFPQQAPDLHSSTSMQQPYEADSIVIAILLRRTEAQRS